MKTIFFTLFLTLLFCDLYSPVAGYDVNITMPVEDETERFQPLWEAVCMVESSNNYHALNTLEMAYGIAQIKQIRLDDYNQRTGEHLGLLQCYDENYSRKIFMYYAVRLKDYETIAKRWNGFGPKTEVYWEKVQVYLTPIQP